MDKEVMQFIVEAIKRKVHPQEILKVLMQKFGMSAEEAKAAIEAVVAELKGAEGGEPQGSQQGPQDGSGPGNPENQEGQKGNASAEKVLGLLGQLQVPPDAAVVLVKEIFELNEAGLRNLIQALQSALEQGGGQQQGQHEQ